MSLASRILTAILVFVLLATAAAAPQVEKGNGKAPTTCTTMLKISGMHCSSCALRIRRSLQSIPGVTHVTVDFASRKGKVVHDTAQCKPERLVETIRKQGYTAELER